MALEGLRQIPHVKVLGSEKAEEHCGILTFTVDGVHPHDVSQHLFLQHAGGDRGAFEERGRNQEENGIWRIEVFTMRY